MLGVNLLGTWWAIDALPNHTAAASQRVVGELRGSCLALEAVEARNGIGLNRVGNLCCPLP